MSVWLRKWKDKEGKPMEAWYVHVKFRHGDGHVTRVRQASPVDTRRGAEQFERIVREQLLAGTFGKKPDGVVRVVPTLEDFVPVFMTSDAEANRNKPSTIQGKYSVINYRLIPMFGKKRLNQITALDVQSLKAAMKDTRPKTVNNTLVVLNKLLKVAVKFGVLDSMPVRIELLRNEPPEMRFYEFGQYADLVEAAGKLDPLTLAMVLLGGDAGLRLGEMLAFEWSDIDFKRHILSIQRGEWRGKVSLPKGGRARKVPMTIALAEALSQLRHLRGPRVFYRDPHQDPAKNVMSQQTLKSWMAAAQKRANLEVTSGIHILRHTFCSHLAMKGAAAVAIKELAGHRSLATTMRYMHLSPSEKERAIAMLNDRPVEAPMEHARDTCGTHEGKTEAATVATSEHH